MPLSWKPHKRAQKDVDAKWTKKHGRSYFGYKLHASVDKRCKLIRKIAITHAAVADTNVFEELLDPSNTSRDVYADQGYPSIERESRLKQAGWRAHPATRSRDQRHFRDAEAAQPRDRYATSPCRACVRRLGPDGWETGALPRHRTYDLSSSLSDFLCGKGS